MKCEFYSVSVHAVRFNTENTDGVSDVEEQNSDWDPGKPIYQLLISRTPHCT
jgi:hypothetical protein